MSRLDPALRKAGVWLVAGLLYLLWPLDVVPDWMVLVGWADDLIVAGLAVYMAYLSFKNQMAKTANLRIEPTDEEDPYAVLGVFENSSPELIEEAYKERMEQYLPEKLAGMGPELRALAEKKVRQIQRAYDRLKGR